ncbi:MAG TPA: hypothetical protein VF087_03925, partial [Solirubrobacteraceae bacterium]
LAQESVRVLRRRGVETVILAGADTHGIMRGKRVPIAEFDRAAEHGIARVEHRLAGADANPYLAAAGALAAGLDGVRRASEPPQPVDGDVYALADGAAPALPATLGAATDLLERSTPAREWLGDDVVDHCVAMRRAELAAQSAAVTDWETARYLEAL